MNSGIDDSPHLTFFRSPVRSLAGQAVLLCLLLTQASLATELDVGSKRHDAPFSSVAASGGASLDPAISADGQVVAFISWADDLIPDQDAANLNGVPGVFVTDAQGTDVELINPGEDRRVFTVNLSGDGRYVAYASSVIHSTPEPSRSVSRVFSLYDRVTGATEIIFSGLGGNEALISDDGQRIAFTTKAALVAEDNDGGASDLYVFSRASNEFRLLDGPDDSFLSNIQMSRSGRYALAQYDSNYILHDIDSDSEWQIGGELTLAEASLSNDAEKIAFLSRYDYTTRTNDVYLWTRATEQLEGPLPDVEQRISEIQLSADGSELAFKELQSATNPATNLLLQAEKILTLDTGAIRVLPDIGDPAERRIDRTYSADLSQLVFSSTSTAFEQADPNTETDVFFEDVASQTVRRISNSYSSIVIEGANASSRSPQVSRDGRWLLYSSEATDITAEDAAQTDDDDVDLFLFDRINDTTIKITTAPEGRKNGGRVSDNGQFVVFSSTSNYATEQDTEDTDGLFKIYVWERATGQYSLITIRPDGHSTNPRISDDGRIVVFQSGASNLIDDAESTCQIYRHNRDTGITDCVPSDSTATGLANGRYELSGEGTHLVTTGNGNSRLKLQHINLTTGEILTPLAEDVNPTDADISADGRFIVFASRNEELIDGRSYSVPQIFVWDAVTRETELITEGSIHYNRWPAISGNGQFVAFWSQDPSLHPDDTNGDHLDVFLFDRQTRQLEIITPGANDSRVDLQAAPRMSHSGQVLAFETRANNLAPVARANHFNVLYYLNDAAPTANNAPVAIAQNLQVQQSESLTLELMADDSDGDELTFSIETGPQHGELLGSLPVLSYQPQTDYVGVDQFTFIASDGTDTSTPATITIEVLADPQPPVENAPPRANAQSLAVDTDGTLNIVLSGSDSEDTDLSFEVTGLPNHGVLESALPAVTYRPNPGFIGNDSFLFDVIDSEGARGQASVEIAVGRPRPVASVLPSSRSVRVGENATVFASMINPSNSTALGCYPETQESQPVTSQYQATDPATNQPIGEPNTPINIAAGMAGTFVLIVQPSQVFPLTPLAINFVCSNTYDVESLEGINTLALASTEVPAPDLIAIALTPTANGILNLPQNGSYSAMSLATVNVGASATVRVAGAAPGTAIDDVLICETNPVSGTCKADPAPSVTLDIDAGATASFGVFARSSAPISLDPANNRLELTFLDTESSLLAGSTSVAIQTQ